MEKTNEVAKKIQKTQCYVKGNLKTLGGRH